MFYAKTFAKMFLKHFSTIERGLKIEGCYM